jgi:hypothetical protein
MRSNKSLAIGLVAVLAAVAVGCGKREEIGPSEGKASAPGAKAAEHGDSDLARATRFDQYAEKAIASSKAFEARTWFKTPKHVVFKHGNQQVTQLVDEFYQAGATQVYVADVEEHGGTQFATHLIVTLPKDAAGRTETFSVAKKAEQLTQTDPISDVGQKYLLFSLD